MSLQGCKRQAKQLLLLRSTTCILCLLLKLVPLQFFSKL